MSHWNASNWLMHQGFIRLASPMPLDTTFLTTTDRTLLARQVHADRRAEPAPVHRRD
jgi:hypothetical protein